jgi:predicted RNA methylase
MCYNDFRIQPSEQRGTAHRSKEEQMHSKNEYLNQVSKIIPEAESSRGYYAQMTAWVDSHRNWIGTDIMDIGCGTGVLSCYLARVFPHAFVLGVDRDPAAIDTARKLAHSLELPNIRFVCEDICGIEEKNLCDTVVVSGLSHEMRGEPADLAAADSYPEKCRAWQRAYMKYARRLERVLAAGGVLIAADRFTSNAAGCGLYLAYHKAGITPNFNFYQKLPEEDMHLILGNKGVNRTEEEIFRQAGELLRDRVSDQEGTE